MSNIHNFFEEMEFCNWIHAQAILSFKVFAAHSLS